MSGREEVDEALREELLALGTATLYEAAQSECYLPAVIRPVWEGAALVGRALPVRTLAGDNLALHLALEVAAPGDVLVVDTAGTPYGYWGEVLAVAARVRGVGGLVIDGGVRDTVRLRELGFPVFAGCITVRGTVKRDPGEIATPIRLGTAEIARGDVVVGDADGVVVLPADRVSAVLEAARARQRKEVLVMERISAGELTVDVLGLPRAVSLWRE